MTDHIDLLQSVLPVLREAHRCVAGLPFAGSPQSLRVELGIAVVKVDRHVRKAMADDCYDAAERFAFDTALDTVVAMDSGEMPFDQGRYDAAREHMRSSFLRGFEKRRRAPRAEPQPKRLHKQ